MTSPAETKENKEVLAFANKVINDIHDYRDSKRSWINHAYTTYKAEKWNAEVATEVNKDSTKTASIDQKRILDLRAIFIDFYPSYSNINDLPELINIFEITVAAAKFLSNKISQEAFANEFNRLTTNLDRFNPIYVGIIRQLRKKFLALDQKSQQIPQFPIQHAVTTPPTEFSLDEYVAELVQLREQALIIEASARKIFIRDSFDRIEGALLAFVNAPTAQNATILRGRLKKENYLARKYNFPELKRYSEILSRKIKTIYENTVMYILSPPPMENVIAAQAAFEKAVDVCRTSYQSIIDDQKSSHDDKQKAQANLAILNESAPRFIVRLNTFKTEKSIRAWGSLIRHLNVARRILIPKSKSNSELTPFLNAYNEFEAAAFLTPPQPAIPTKVRQQIERQIEEKLQTINPKSRPKDLAALRKARETEPVLVTLKDRPPAVVPGYEQKHQAQITQRSTSTNPSEEKITSMIEFLEQTRTSISALFSGEYQQDVQGAEQQTAAQKLRMVRIIEEGLLPIANILRQLQARPIKLLSSELYQKLLHLIDQTNTNVEGIIPKPDVATGTSAASSAAPMATASAVAPIGSLQHFLNSAKQKLQNFTRNAKEDFATLRQMIFAQKLKNELEAYLIAKKFTVPESKKDPKTKSDNYDRYDQEKVLHANTIVAATTTFLNNPSLAAWQTFRTCFRDRTSTVDRFDTHRHFWDGRLGSSEYVKLVQRLRSEFDTVDPEDREQKLGEAKEKPLAPVFETKVTELISKLQPYLEKIKEDLAQTTSDQKTKQEARDHLTQEQLQEIAQRFENLPWNIRKFLDAKAEAIIDGTKMPDVTKESISIQFFEAREAVELIRRDINLSGETLEKQQALAAADKQLATIKASPIFIQQKDQIDRMGIDTERYLFVWIDIKSLSYARTQQRQSEAAATHAKTLDQLKVALHQLKGNPTQANFDALTRLVSNATSTAPKNQLISTIPTVATTGSSRISSTTTASAAASALVTPPSSSPVASTLASSPDQKGSPEVVSDFFKATSPENLLLLRTTMFAEKLQAESKRYLTTGNKMWPNFWTTIFVKNWDDWTRKINDFIARDFRDLTQENADQYNDFVLIMDSSNREKVNNALAIYAVVTKFLRNPNLQTAGDLIGQLLSLMNNMGRFNQHRHFWEGRFGDSVYAGMMQQLRDELVQFASPTTSGTRCTQTEMKMTT